MPYYMPQSSGELIGPLQVTVVPGHGPIVPTGAIELPELPGPRACHVWVWRDGQAVELPDHRGTYYRADTGERVEHTELGELPEGLTPEPRPGPHYAWQDGAWVLDEAAQAADTEVAERAWRDERIASTDYLAMPDYPLTEAARSELYAYRQALRDWPQAEAFPEPAGRPSPPAWLLPAI